MRMTQRTLVLLTLVVVGVAVAATAGADVLTVDRAVDMALQRSSQMVGAQANVLQAQGGLYSAYSGVLPSVSAGLSRNGSWEKKGEGAQFFGSNRFPVLLNDSERYSTSPSLNGSWSVLNLSSLAGLRSAQSGLRAAHHARTAAANDVALATKRQFYEVVKAIHLVDVTNGALRLARDNERRVRALFEVGSVSRSDLLKAQVSTAQSELDSLTASQSVVNQRVLLSEQLGIAESQLGDVDTTLTPSARDYDEATLLAEAEKGRPDILAAEAQLRAAEGALRAANFRRLPYVALNGGATYRPRSNSKQTTFQAVDTGGNIVDLSTPDVRTGYSKADMDYSASISLNWNLFTGLATEASIANARASVLRARNDRDALRRDLVSEVHQSILQYRAAVESDRVSRRAIESATENLKLTQQKYNVGSATILDLIDAQVQLQRAQSQGVTSQAAIRVAEAQIERVRGGGSR